MIRRDSTSSNSRPNWTPQEPMDNRLLIKTLTVKLTRIVVTELNRRLKSLLFCGAERGQGSQWRSACPVVHNYVPHLNIPGSSQMLIYKMIIFNVQTHTGI